MFIDSHAHLDYEYDVSVDELVANAQAAGITHIISIAAAPESLDNVVAIAQKFPNIYHTSGIHPHDSVHWSPEIFAKVKHNASLPKCVAIGELGLDYYYNLSTKEQQFAALEPQLDFSAEIKKPIVLHTRDAEEDTIAQLKIHSQKWYAGNTKHSPGVVHCFTGTQSLADKALELGYMISFSGIVTFKNAEPLRSVAKSIPLDKILVETDSPFLAPIPHRGKKNQPAYTIHVAKLIAELKGVSLEELGKQTTQNTKNLFGF